MLTTIDKVKLSSTNYSLDDVNMLGINCHNKQPNKELSVMPCGIDAKGNELIGINAFIHSIDIPYHLNLQQDYFGDYRAWVEFNPNKFNSLEDAVNKIDHHLKEVNRFEFNWNQTQLSRVDIACDETMVHHPRDYHQSIKSIMKHKYGKNEKKLPDSLTYSVDGWQKCIYDKQLKNQIDEAVKSPKRSNLMRDELRMIKPAYIQKHLGISDLNSLLELNESNLKSLFVDTSNKFIREQQLIAIKKRKKPEELDSVVKVVEYLIDQPPTIRILTYLNTGNDETNFLMKRQLYFEACHEAFQFDKKGNPLTKQNRWYKLNREMNLFDSIFREQNEIRQQRKQQDEESSMNKLIEYRAKFLVA